MTSEKGGIEEETIDEKQTKLSYIRPNLEFEYSSLQRDNLEKPY